jgi:tyrosinase
MSALAAGTTVLPLDFAAAQSSSKYVRPNVNSLAGQRALSSYSRGVQEMLKLPADHPHNWFRYAFIHFFDCPHGNWWFYVWHRGYLAYFEQIIRELSKDSTFALPYWDWTSDPHVPTPMFAGALDPHDISYAPYTVDLDTFTKFIKPALSKYWKSLTQAQLDQLKARGYTSLDLAWNDVIGFDLQTNKYVPANMCFSSNKNSRYLTAPNSKLDGRSSGAVRDWVVYAGLMPGEFYNSIASLSFNSSKTPTHHTSPPDSTVFSILEGQSHNLVHNSIGGVGPLDPGPYGFMTNYLSPCDPIFYLHHANIDRLWDVWTRKQKIRNLSAQPSNSDMSLFANEPFLFFVDANGNSLNTGKAWDYFDNATFDYSYDPGFGEAIVKPLAPAVAGYVQAESFNASIRDNIARVPLSVSLIQKHLDTAIVKPALVAEVTLMRPHGDSFVREFDIIIGAPSEVKHVSPESPYYAGTVAFFGNMSGMKMPMNNTFVVPLPRSKQIFSAALQSTSQNGGKAMLNVRVVPAQGESTNLPTISSVTVREASH